MHHAQPTQRTKVIWIINAFYAHSPFCRDCQHRVEEKTWHDGPGYPPEVTYTCRFEDDDSIDPLECPAYEGINPFEEE